MPTQADDVIILPSDNRPNFPLTERTTHLVHPSHDNKVQHNHRQSSHREHRVESRPE